MIENMIFEIGEDPCPTINWTGKLSEQEINLSTEKLYCYTAACGYKIELVHNCHTRIDHSLRTIFINSAYGRQRIYYVLLHEIGHMVLNLKNTLSNGEIMPYVLNYPGLADKKMAAQRTSSRRYAITLIHEELDAWRKGIDIAHALQLPLSTFEYTELASKSVATYVSAAYKYC